VYPSYVSLASRGPTSTTPVATIAVRKHATLGRKIQVTGGNIIGLGRIARGPATFSYLLASQRVPEPYAWLCKLPISGRASNVYFPALYHKSVVTPRLFLFFQSRPSTPPPPLVHITFPRLERRQMWRYELGCKNGNGRKSGVIL
jgi:hypothetical protein